MREIKKLKSDNYFEFTYKIDCDVFVTECIDRTDTELSKSEAPFQITLLLGTCVILIIK